VKKLVFRPNQASGEPEVRDADDTVEQPQSTGWQLKEVDSPNTLLDGEPLQRIEVWKNGELYTTVSSAKAARKYIADREELANSYA